MTYFTASFLAPVILVSFLSVFLLPCGSSNAAAVAVWLVTAWFLLFFFTFIFYFYFLFDFVFATAAAAAVAKQFIKMLNYLISLKLAFLSFCDLHSLLWKLYALRGNHFPPHFCLTFTDFLIGSICCRCQVYLWIWQVA